MPSAGDPGRARSGRSRPTKGPRAAASRSTGDRPSVRGGGERSSGRAGARASAVRPPGGARGESGAAGLGRGAPAAPGEKVRVGVAGGASESIRGSRAHRMAVVTSGMLGVSSTRRAAILALVVCALALTVAVPLRNYLTQRQELSALQAKQRQLTSQVDDLARRRDQLDDPTQLQAEARDRLGYVRPGETPYVVQLPSDVMAAPAGAAGAGSAPWFNVLWSDVRGVPR